ncbi:YiiD C-terminal domain-containing protein [Arcobacter sp. LA11]|uniref:YiiD C-terminal domain-containing protein n=1 Tax=Arcobacter sp. LA11 TaxID=1898176 RepID=UPI000933C250|nr:YiiD C-terminal domain-containing protein [Arcobacter sp. LA11]
MLKTLENKLHSQIPMTKLMKLHVKAIDKEKLITTAPLDININDKGTGFAGSLSTIVTISAWSSCFLKIDALGYKNPMIAIIKSDTAYRAPVTKDIYCETNLPTYEQLELVKEKLKLKGSASLKIKSKIIENEKVCVEFEGIYVIKV